MEEKSYHLGEQILLAKAPLQRSVGIEYLRARLLRRCEIATRCRPLPGGNRCHGLNDGFTRRRLGQVGGKTGFAAPPDVLFLPISAQGDAGEPESALAELAHQIVAAAIRQPQIAQQQIEIMLAGQFQCRRHVASRFDRVTFGGQYRSHHLAP